MATQAHHLIRDQNLNLLYNGATPVGKTNIAKADNKRGLGKRKALDDISNSRKPSAILSAKKDHMSKNLISIEKDRPCEETRAKLSKVPDKRKIERRKALSDVTNSVKQSSSSQHLLTVSRKLYTIAEENIPSCSVEEERFLRRHQGCIKAQLKPVDHMDYFLKSVGLREDLPVLPLSAKREIQSSSSMKGNMMRLATEENPGQLFENQVSLCKKSKQLPCLDFSPACNRSPKSPMPPYVNWEDDKFSDLRVIETPKLL